MANLRTNFVATIFVTSVASALTRLISLQIVSALSILYCITILCNFAARQNIDLVWRDNGAYSNFITCCILLSCKHRSDGGRNTPYGVPVVEATIPSKSSGALND